MPCSVLGYPVLRFRAYVSLCIYPATFSEALSQGQEQSAHVCFPLCGPESAQRVCRLDDAIRNATATKSSADS